MKEYSLKDSEVRRVLVCLKDLKHHSLDQIVAEYNQLYPPSFLLPVPRSSSSIKAVLDFTLKEGLVRSEVMTFYEEPIPATKFFVLTGKGINFLNARR